MLGLIRAEFADDPELCSDLNTVISMSGERRYQEAFRFLQSRRGAAVSNELVRTAVLSACAPGERYRAIGGDEQGCQVLEAEEAHWTVSPGANALASLIAKHPAVFGRAVLTTNFDPLLEIAITRAGGKYYKTIMQGDGNLSMTSAPGCQVVHLHGYWYGSNTFHTVRQLTQPRPQLKASLIRLLRGRIVVLCAYGGWNDIFTSTLFEMVADDNEDMEILWTSLSPEPSFPPEVEDRLAAAGDKGKIFLYSGVDCNEFIPALDDWWNDNATVVAERAIEATSPVRFEPKIIAALSGVASPDHVVEGDDEDRPPITEFCVGRDRELDLLSSSTGQVTFISGIGGQGKSTVAARVFGNEQARAPHRIYVWRDCKEESERFENQLASIVESLTNGRVRGLDLAKQETKAIVDVLIPLLADRSAFFVFDNIDHYVDLEGQGLTANVRIFVDAVLENGASTRLLFTSRPSVASWHSSVSTIQLEGLSLSASKALFSARGANSTEGEITEAYELTDGHAFWLDLLAIQVARPDQSISLGKMLMELRAGKGDLPTKMLQSTWSKLKDREHIVLRAMAETVRPEREREIADYVSSELNFHKVFKALKSLRSANLVVVKRLRNKEEVLELHPLVRSFIRRQYSHKERLPIINGIVRVYARFIGSNRNLLEKRPTFLVLQNWTQAAELNLVAGKIAAAYSILGESLSAFSSSAYPREFTRVARLVIGEGDFVKDHAKYEFFDRVFRSQVNLLSYLGEFNEVDSLLNKFALTVLAKDSRFLLYCHLRAYTYWVRKDYVQAVEWGKRGSELKNASSVDSDSEVEHTLALALRDSGLPDEALPTFLVDRKLEAVTDPDEYEEERGGAHYGNIGRCLQFMGELDGALVCYQKSALSIEKDRRHEHLLNQGFIRLWVGELFVAKKKVELGLEFLEAARRKWNQVNPLEADRIGSLQEQIEGFDESLRDRSRRVEGRFQDWIVGKLD